MRYRPTRDRHQRRDQGGSGFWASLESPPAALSASPGESQMASWISMNFLASAWQSTQMKISPVLSREPRVRCRPQTEQLVRSRGTATFSRLDLEPAFGATRAGPSRGAFWGTVLCTLAEYGTLTRARPSASFRIRAGGGGSGFWLVADDLNARCRPAASRRTAQHAWLTVRRSRGLGPSRDALGRTSRTGSRTRSPAA